MKPSLKVDPNEKFGKDIRRKDITLVTNPKKVSNKLKKAKLSKKSIGTSIVAGTLILITLVSCGKKNDVVLDSTIEEEKTITTKFDLNGIGVELQFPDDSKLEQPKYGNTTGNIDVTKIVKDSEGNNWTSEEAKNNSKNTGVKIDTKGDTLVVNKDGSVSTKTEGYEIIDSNGKVISSGNGAPTNNNTNNGYVYADSNYYDKETGELVLSRGELVTPDALKYAKANLTTTKVSKQPETPAIPSNNEGTNNSDGTYTMYGLTFESKDDYEQWVIQGYTGYGIDEDGVMKSEETILGENSNEKVR